MVRSVEDYSADGVLKRLVDNHRRFLAFLIPRVREEILQSAFVRATEKQATIRDDESAVAWFYRLLRNALVDYYADVEWNADRSNARHKRPKRANRWIRPIWNEPSAPASMT